MDAEAALSQTVILLQLCIFVYARHWSGRSRNGRGDMYKYMYVFFYIYVYIYGIYTCTPSQGIITLLLFLVYCLFSHHIGCAFDAENGGDVQMP